MDRFLAQFSAVPQVSACSKERCILLCDVVYIMCIQKNCILANKEFNSPQIVARFDKNLLIAIITNLS